MQQGMRLESQLTGDAAGGVDLNHRPTLGHRQLFSSVSTLVNYCCWKVDDWVSVANEHHKVFVPSLGI